MILLEICITVRIKEVVKGNFIIALKKYIRGVGTLHSRVNDINFHIGSI